jgi:hypothetical protein
VRARIVAITNSLSHLLMCAYTHTSRPVDRNDVTQYVLGPFTDEENAELHRTVFPSIYALLLKHVDASSPPNVEG